jgi:outer membrane immunogenic protein
MKKLIAAPLLLALTSMPLVSWAGTDSGFYVGASVGKTSVEDDFDSSFNVKDDDNGHKIFFGYNFGLVPLLDLAVEADYREYGKFGNGAINTEVTSSEVFGVVGFNLGLIGVFGKLGYSDTDLESAAGNVNFDDSESATAYGVGAKINFGSFGIRAEYEELDLDAVDDFHMISVGATYTF